LATNLAIAAQPGLALGLSQYAQEDHSLLIFSDETSAQAQQFAGQLNTPHSNIEKDVGLHFDTFNRFHREQPTGWITGLTRDSDFFILEQMAATKGYRTVFSAIHETNNNTVTHQVSSSVDKAHLIADSLAQSLENWPSWLANNITSLAHHELATAQANSQAGSSTNNEYLVSWLLIPSTSA
tara:strand:- start:545 stop:1090 length:546 start_codon:yes stop_codon:yes gene_type:complete